MNRLLILVAPLLLAADWPQWRGPTGDGVSPETGFPTEWSATKNVKWKVKLPGAGNGSPVVMGPDVILTATSGRDHSDLHVLCFDRESGRAKWTTNLFGTPADAPFSMFPPERGHAASTPAVTDKQIVALFGTGDFVCLDRAGRPLWLRSLSREFGAFRNDYGIAASPVAVDGTVLVQIDHLNGSYLLAVHADTGKTKWKADRRDAYDNWSTPVVAAVGGKKHVIACGTKKLTGYDLATGDVVWATEGLERLCSPTPIVRGNKLYAVSGPAGANVAFELHAADKPKVLWQSKKNGPFVPSAIVVNELYFVADDQGTVTCLDLKTGAEKWRERIANGRMRPSPVAAEGRVYFTALDGTTHVVRATAAYEPLGKNVLGEDVAASLALANRGVFVRSAGSLWCFAE